MESSQSQSTFLPPAKNMTVAETKIVFARIPKSTNQTAGDLLIPTMEPGRLLYIDMKEGKVTKLKDLKVVNLTVFPLVEDTQYFLNMNGVYLSSNNTVHFDITLMDAFAKAIGEPLVSLKTQIANTGVFEKLANLCLRIGGKNELLMKHNALPPISKEEPNWKEIPSSVIIAQMKNFLIGLTVNRLNVFINNEKERVSTELLFAYCKRFLEISELTEKKQGENVPAIATKKREVKTKESILARLSTSMAVGRVTDKTLEKAAEKRALEISDVELNDTALEKFNKNLSTIKAPVHLDVSKITKKEIDDEILTLGVVTFKLQETKDNIARNLDLSDLTSIAAYVALYGLVYSHQIRMTEAMRSRMETVIKKGLCILPGEGLSISSVLMAEPIPFLIGFQNAAAKGMYTFNVSISAKFNNLPYLMLCDDSVYDVLMSYFDEGKSEAAQDKRRKQKGFIRYCRQQKQTEHLANETLKSLDAAFNTEYKVIIQLSAVKATESIKKSSAKQIKDTKKK